MPSGPEVDAGGIISINGIPVWVPPWSGPDGPLARAVRDIYVGLATLTSASLITHAETREAIQRSAVELINLQGNALSKEPLVDLRPLETDAQAMTGAKVRR